MFGKQTAERFEKERKSLVGPGSYDLPSTLEGMSTGAGDELELSGMLSTEIPADASPVKAAEEKIIAEKSIAEQPTPARNATADKESQISSARGLSAGPATKSKKDLRSTSPRGPPAPPMSKASTKPSSKAPAGPPTPTGSAVSSAAEAEARQRHRDLRLAAQLDMVRDELKQKSKEAKELQLGLAAKDRKIEELQKKIEELAADKREANRRTVEAESERDMKRRQLHEKEQDLLALQRKNEKLRLINEERCRRSDNKDEEHRVAQADLQRLKSSVDALQERLAASERDRQTAEQGLRQQQRRNQEIEDGVQSTVRLLEEQLASEANRRRELEERRVQEGAVREQGETELADERRRSQELQSSVTQLQEERKTQLAADMQRAEQRSQLEDELCKLRAEAQARNESLQRLEASKEDSERCAARAEASLQACSRELAAAQAQNVELEEERQRFGESQYSQLQEKVEASEKQLKDLGQDLADERARCEELERQAAAFQEKEQAAKHAAEDERQSRLRDPTFRELENRALAAEAEAEEAHQMLQRWKEWGDEQQLRELTAETERLEKLKEVREDVTRQVEAARKELVDENRALQQKLLEMENGPGGSATQELLEEREKRLGEQAAVLARYSDRQKDLEAELDSLRKRMELDYQRHHEQQLKLEEQCRSLEARAARAEADASVAADEFADERDQFRAQQRALTAEHAKALESKLKSCSQQLEGKGQELTQLNEILKSTKAKSASFRWQLLADALSRVSHAAAQEDLFAQVRKAAKRAEAKTRGIDTERVVRQELEMERLDQENEKLKEQNRQVLLSLQMQQQDLQIALAETRRLSEREAAYESDVLRMSERSAELGGHANPKQKIKHLMSVKEENQSLRQELKRTKQSIAQLEGQLRAAQFFEAASAQPLASEASSGTQTRPRTPSRRMAQPQQPMTPGRPPASTPGAACEPEQSQKAEQLRMARAHRRASERAANEYQHLYGLVERALAMGSLQSAASPGNTETPTAQSGDGTVSARAHADHNELYRRLRRLSMNFSTGSNGSDGLAAPGTASPEGPGLQTPKGKGCETEPEEEASVSRGLGRPYDDCLPHLDSLV